MLSPVLFEQLIHVYVVSVSVQDDIALNENRRL